MIKNDCQRGIIGFLGRTRYNKSKSGEKQEGKDMEFNDVLALRKSMRNYKADPVSKESEEEMLKAAMASSVGKHNDAIYHCRRKKQRNFRNDKKRRKRKNGKRRSLI